MALLTTERPEVDQPVPPAVDRPGLPAPGQPDRAPFVGGPAPMRSQWRPPRSLPRIACGVLALGTSMLVLNLLLFSRMAHTSAQSRMLASFRNALAQGVAPVGPTDTNGVLLALGTPVALLQIPSLGVSEVVGEGTTPELLTHGPGHLRTTVLPGGVGVSDIFGRQASYGGPFSRIATLKRGATIRIADGLGQFTYKVIDVRHAGNPVPAPISSGGSRITLLTGDGTHFLPSGVVRVDADLAKGQAVAVPAGGMSLSRSELAMRTDTSTVWQLVLWLEALLVLVVASSWSWARWGRTQTWITFLPPVLLVLYFISDQTTRFLPNLL